jgi:hypothetical protein
MSKQIDRNATIAWSPLPQYPHILAGGTASGTIDNSFDLSASIELFDLKAPGDSLPVIGRTTCEDRICKLVWSSLGSNSSSLPYGVLASSMSNGTIGIWNPEKIIK